MSTPRTLGSPDPLSDDEGTRRVELDFLKRLLDAALAQSIAATHSASKRRHEPNQEQAVRDRLAAFDNPVFGRLAE